MDTFDLSDIEQRPIIKIKCAWCNRINPPYIKAFDGRIICKDMEPCNKIGAHINHTIGMSNG